MTERSPLQLSARDRERLVELDALVASSDVVALTAQLDDPSWAVRRSVVSVLARIGEPAIEELCIALRDRRDNEARIAAVVDTLALLNAPGHVEARVLALANETAVAAIWCDIAQILGRRHAATAIPWLAAATANPDDNVSVSAIEALGRIGPTGDPAGVEALIAVVAGDNFFRTFPAIEVLGDSGDVRAVPALIALLDQPFYALPAIRALGRTADERAIAPLAAMLLAADDAAVRVAAVAIDQIHQQHTARYGAAETLVTALRASANVATVGQRLGAVLRDASGEEQIAICRVVEWLSADAAIRALFALILTTANASAPVVVAATHTLKQLGERIDVVLQEELASKDGVARLSLMPLVGGRAGNLTAVVACLDDTDPSVRAAACDALGRIGKPTIIEHLFERLRDADPRVVLAAVSAIQSLGSERTEALALALAASPESKAVLRRAALRIISYFGYASGLDALLAGMRDPDERLRDIAIGGLPFLDDERALQALLAGVDHVSARTRASVMRALGQCGGTFVNKVALRRGLTDADAWVRYYACQALGKLRDNEAETETAIIALLHDPAGQVRAAAIDALAQLEVAHESSDETAEQSPAFSALCAASESDDRDTQRAALLGLSLSKRHEALTLLLGAARSTDVATRLVALAGIATRKTPEVIAALAFAGNDSDESVRAAAIAYLAARDSQDATLALCVLLRAPEARAAAAAALTQARPESATGERAAWLLVALRDADAVTAPLVVGALARLNNASAHAAIVSVLAARDTPFVASARVAAAHVLGELTGAEFRDALKRAAVDDPDAEVRRVAALALGE